MAAVLLLTHRPAFESVWSVALGRSGLSTRRVSPAEVTDELARHQGLVVDGASHEFADGELLGCVALAHARAAVPAIVLGDQRFDRLDDLLVELCRGLVARSETELERLVRGLRRRCDPERGTRFAHVTGSKRALVAIFDDAQIAVCPRPISSSDSGATIEAITITQGSRSARVSLDDGAAFQLDAKKLTNSFGDALPAAQDPANSLGDVDGARLGQRLRALRIAAGLTQAELARRTGIHRPNIARVEAGRHTPSLETLARLAAAIGVSTTRVLSD